MTGVVKKVEEETMFDPWPSVSTTASTLYSVPDENLQYMIKVLEGEAGRG